MKPPSPVAVYCLARKPETRKGDQEKHGLMGLFYILLRVFNQQGEGLSHTTTIFNMQLLLTESTCVNKDIMEEM